MVRTTTRIPMDSRILVCNSNNYYLSDGSGECEMEIADGVFGFLDRDWDSSPESNSNNGYCENEAIEEDEDDIEDKGSRGNDKAYWENQHQLLHATLCRSSSLESKIRNATKEAQKEAKITGNYCICRRQVAEGGCKKCLIRVVCGRLQNEGFNSATCKSKWRTSPDIPSGEHTFIDVVDNSSPKKGEIRIIIELNFRAEFEVARASEEYNKLIKRLPEVFVGKIERLQNLIKILCSAAKKCMKENKMHMGPWRKHKYMHAKWLGTCDRTASVPSWSTVSSVQVPRPRRASMLTVDLLDNLTGLHNATFIKVA